MVLLALLSERHFSDVMAEVLEVAEGSSGTDFDYEIPDFLFQLNTTMREICTSYNVSILEQLQNHFYAQNITDINLVEECTNSPKLPPIFGTFVQIFYALVCLIGLCGNTLVIYVVLRYSKMQTVTYIYILMLAIADEIFLLGIPFLVITMFQGYWIFGFSMCKIYYTTTSINQVSN